MSYKDHFFKELIQFLSQSVIEYNRVDFKETSFYPYSFIEFVQKKEENFSYFPMGESKYTQKIKRFAHTLFRKKHPDISLYLILFLHGNPYEQKIIHLHQAYDFYTLLENMLISDWAIADSRFQFIIYADDIAQNFVLSENAHKESLIYVHVNHKFPPHETVN